MVPLVKTSLRTNRLSYRHHFSHMFSSYINEYDYMDEEISCRLSSAMDMLYTNFTDIPRTCTIYIYHS